MTNMDKLDTALSESQAHDISDCDCSQCSDQRAATTYTSPQAAGRAWTTAAMRGDRRAGVPQ